MAKMDGKPDSMVVAGRRNSKLRIAHYERMKAATSDPEWHEIYDRLIQKNRDLLANLMDEERHGVDDQRGGPNA